jgi:DnaK suppressor protein
MLKPEFISKMRDELLSEKAEVERNIAELKVPELALDNPDFDDLANDAVEDILQGSSLSVLNNLLDKIELALERIEMGVYGYCLETGRELPEELLEKEPWLEALPPIMRQ